MILTLYIKLVLSLEVSQILMSLISNACEAVSGGDAWVRLEFKTKNSCLECRVIDNSWDY